MHNVIFSHMTALYLHGLSIKNPNDIYDITVKRSYNSVHLRKHNVFYVDNDIYELGIIESKHEWFIFKSIAVDEVRIS